MTRPRPRRPRDVDEAGNVVQVEVGSDDYFDPNATSDSWPGVVGLNMRSHHWWAGDDAWDTYEELGPGDGSVYTTPPDATTSGGANGGVPGGTPGGGPIAPDGFSSSINGMPLVWCEEDGVPMDLIGTEGNTITIILQGVQDIGDFWFPVNPEELSASFDQDNDYEVDTIGVGEVIIPGTERLESVGWSSFLPLTYDGSYVSIPSGLMYPPDYAMQKLVETKRKRLICFLCIGGTIWNDFVVIKSLKWSAKTGEPGDIFYDIEFKRYRDVTIQTVEVPGAGVSDPRDAPGTGGPQTTPNADNPNGSDGTNPGEQQVNAPPTDTASSQTTTATISPQEGLNRVGVGIGSQIQKTQYLTTPGPTGNGQSIQDVYDDIKKQGNGDYNTVDQLETDNSSQPTGWIVPGALSTRRGTVGEYAVSEPLPIGTVLYYWKHTKDTAPASFPNKLPSADPSPGSLSSILQGKSDILGRPTTPGGGGGGGGSGGFGP